MLYSLFFSCLIGSILCSSVHILFSVFQLSDWVQEKYQTANDESWRDLTNLLPKLQKHQAFEAELKANEERLGHINEVSRYKGKHRRCWDNRV